MNEAEAEAGLRKMAAEVSDPLGGVLRSLFNMLDAERAKVRGLQQEVQIVLDNAHAAERARLAHKMRTTYPQNKHALEWAEWILRESMMVDDLDDPSICQACGFKYGIDCTCE